MGIKGIVEVRASGDLVGKRYMAVNRNAEAACRDIEPGSV